MKVIHCQRNLLEDVSSEKESWLSQAQQGRVLNFQSALNQLGYYSKIVDLTLSVIQSEVSTRIADRIKIEGFEKLHLHLDGQQIEKVNAKLTQVVKPIVSRLVKSFVQDVLGYSSNVYIDSLPVVRFFVPHDVYIENQSRFEKRPGYLKIQGPHHDTWFDHATAGLNMWMAIGRVSKGNGLLIYPDIWGKIIPHDGHRQMPRSQFLGKPMNFEMNRGDLLFFHGEHLHASELNVTQETRFVLTTRFVLKRPKFKEIQQWHPWYASSLINTPYEKLATAHSYFSWGCVRHFLWALSQKVPGPFVPDKGAWHRLEVRRESSQAENETVDLSDLKDQEIRVLSNKDCVLRKGDQLFGFSRYCPHEGADLSLGYYSDGKIFCPWHHLRFDPENGTQPCSKLKNLKVFPYQKNPTKPS